LGLRRYHNEHAAWPSALDQLAEHVPADALLDPTSGGPFIYLLDGDSFRLYSKGADRIDDAGRHGYSKALDRIEDDIVIWPPHVPEPQPQTEAEAQEGREEMIKQLTELYGRRYAERMLSDPNDNQDANNRTEAKPQ
jgi:hypothetical protein